MSDVRVSLRRFHRGPNNSSHPFRNAYKSRDSVATEGNQGAAKRLAGGGKGWDGAKRETKGFDRGLPCCRMKDATTWKTVAARVHALPSPSPPSSSSPRKDCSSLFKASRVLSCGKLAAVIRGRIIEARYILFEYVR